MSDCPKFDFHVVVELNENECVWCGQDVSSESGLLSGGPDVSAYVGGELGLCGCANWDLQNDLFTVLQALYNAQFNEGSTYYTEYLEGESDKYKESLLALLENADTIEHGMAIRGSWLTDRGFKFVELLNNHTRSRNLL